MEQKNQIKLEKFSYSKLSTYESCGWRYKLQYIDKHFIDSSTIANEFGTLVHFVEETMAKDIVANNHEPYFMISDEKYIEMFIEGAIDADGNEILGIKKLKEKYPQDFYKPDKSGLDYNEKANDYLNNGIYRLRDFIAANRNLEIIGIEEPFRLEYRDYLFQGFIDRVFKDKNTGEIFIEDIKTWWSIDGHDVVTPLQFVFYTLAAQQIYQTDNISCFYELPLAQGRYSAGTKGYMKRGLKKIDKLLDAIEAKDFEPNPSPLCHWCVFSKTFPDQPEEAKNLCPYYCKWTKEKKDFSKEFEWMGIENHEAILADFIRNSTPQNNKTSSDPIMLPLNINCSDSDRMFLIRRR